MAAGAFFESLTDTLMVYTPPRLGGNVALGTVMFVSTAPAAWVTFQRYVTGMSDSTSLPEPIRFTVDRPSVATLVNVDRLNESSRLGRIFSEQIAGRMVQRGLRVTEVKLRDNLVLHREQGELLLSREVREVSQAQNAQAVVVGTYAVSASVVYISLKLVNPVGNQVIAAHNYAVPADENVRSLLAGR